MRTSLRQAFLEFSMFSLPGKTPSLALLSEADTAVTSPVICKWKSLICFLSSS